MKKWHLIIDVEKCVDCNNCFLACKDEHVDNDWPGYTRPQPRHGHRWLNIMRAERGQYPLIDVAYRPTTCMHCQNAPCIKAAGGSIVKRPDGIVLIDPDKAQGRRELVKACPYQAIWWNEEQDVPQKCTFCAHLLDQGWQKPRCVQACPTGALRVEYGEEAEMNRICQSNRLEVLQPEYNTQPGVYYQNLYRFTKCFIAGSIAVKHNGVTDCAEGVRISLFSDGKKLAEAVTDNFGDFKIDNLPGNSGQYSLAIEQDGFKKTTVTVELTTSQNIGTVYLG